MTKKPTTEPELITDEEPFEEPLDEPEDEPQAVSAPPEAPAEGGKADESPSDQVQDSEALSGLREELASVNDRHLRLAAEFTNYRRRQEAESAGTWARAQADLLLRFLDVLDDLNRVSGLDPADEAVSVQSIVEGVDLVERKFIRALEDCGAEVIHAEGEPFNPEIMEAMMKVPAESEEQDETVAQVFQKGYMLKGTLVRPARVSVFKAE